MDEQELQQEYLTQVALIKYGTTPSNLTGEQLGQIAFAAADAYQTAKRYGDQRELAGAGEAINSIAYYAVMSGRKTVKVSELMTPKSGVIRYTKSIAELKQKQASKEGSPSA